MSIATMAEGSDPTWRKSDVPALAWGRRVSKIVANMQARIGSYLGGGRFWTPVFGTHAKKKPWRNSDHWSLIRRVTTSALQMMRLDYLTDLQERRVRIKWCGSWETMHHYPFIFSHPTPLFFNGKRVSLHARRSETELKYILTAVGLTPLLYCEVLNLYHIPPTGSKMWRSGWSTGSSQISMEPMHKTGSLGARPWIGIGIALFHCLAWVER